MQQIPEDAKFSMTAQTVTFSGGSLNLKPRVTYVLPSGYKGADIPFPPFFLPPLLLLLLARRLRQ